MNYGLIGTSLFSPDYFASKFESLGLPHQYKAYPLEVISKEIITDLVRNQNLSGFNVTFPFKEQIIGLLDELSDDASSILAVNTVKVIHTADNGFKLKGYNTDWSGFKKAIRPFLSNQHQYALIIGTGGASKAVAYALKTLGIEISFLTSRIELPNSNYFHYSDVNENMIKHFKLIINATPVGTHNVTAELPPLPYQYLTANHLLCDLVYNPTETEFMKMGTKYGAATMNGLAMLKFQADEAWTIWSN